MTVKVRIELDHDGIRELLMSEGVASACLNAAQNIAARAGEGFEVVGPKTLGYGGGRVGYGVAATTYEARLAEAEDKVLSKAVR